MSNQEIYTSLSVKFPFEEIQQKEYFPEFVQEVTENVEAFMMLVTLCKILPLLVLTISLLVIFPPLALVGISFMIFLLSHFFKNLHDLERVSEEEFKISN